MNFIKVYSVYVSVFFHCCCLVAKLCLTLCDPIDSSPPGSSFPGILQARILEWVAIRVALFAHLRLLIFLPAILFTAFDSSDLGFHMMFLAGKL